MTTTALDLSEYVTATDSEELRAFKKRVAEVAKKYTNRHGWCGEVTRALKELGIEEEKKITIVVETGAVKLNVLIRPSELVGLSLPEQKAKLIDALGDVNLGAAGTVKASKLFPLNTIVSITVPPKPAPKAKTAPGVAGDRGEGMWRYVSNDGKVLHRILQPGEMAGGFGGREFRPYSTYNRSRSACGIVVYNDEMTDSSRRGTGRSCAKCATAVVRTELPRL